MPGNRRDEMPAPARFGSGEDRRLCDGGVDLYKKSERGRWLPNSSSIALRPSERGGCEHDEGKHEQHDVCEERHFNDLTKRTRDLERAQRETHLYIYIYIYIYIIEFPRFCCFRKY
jgi:hypothetical protein